jgi:hypothetical protein
VRAILVLEVEVAEVKVKELEELLVLVQVYKEQQVMLPHLLL